VFSVALFIIGILVVLVLTGAPPGGLVLTDILLAAIGAPLFVRLICCAYEFKQVDAAKRACATKSLARPA
jgi:hypothetical protein